jgi:hypothetical protein
MDSFIWARAVSKEIEKSKEPEPVEAFLRRLALMPQAKPAGRRGRLLFALDATASRQPAWDRACQIQGQMFLETASLGGLDVQLVFYRGFGECKASPWVSSSAKLIRYMTSVRCLGGQTQIGKVLAHCLAETEKRKVNALVFVGDCMEEDADELCRLAGELGLANVPAFVFHEGRDEIARQTFEQIAKLSGGACSTFDARSPKILRDLLTAVAVYAAGGKTAMLEFARKAGGEVLRLTSQLGGR